jgi:hypothetical protein
MRAAFFVCLLCFPFGGWAQSDAGSFLSAEVCKEVGKRLSFGLEIEMRTRDAVKDIDRLSAEFQTSYKLCEGLKLSAGYVFLGDHNKRISHYKENDRDYRKGLVEIGDRKNLREYWGLRHRMHVSLTGSHRFGRLKLSLRERWQYTFQPSHIVEGRYNYFYQKGDDAPHLYPTKVSNMLRIRLAAEYKERG